MSAADPRRLRTSGQQRPKKGNKKMSEELAKVDTPVAPEVAPAAEVAAQDPSPAVQTTEPVADSQEQLAPPPEEIPVAPVDAAQPDEAAAEPQQDVEAAKQVVETIVPKADGAPVMPGDLTPEQAKAIKVVATQAKAAAPEKKFKKFKSKHGKPQAKPQATRSSYSAPSDAEVHLRWRQNIAERGYYTDETFIKALCEYGSKHRGFDPKRPWGGTLVTMFNRMGEKLQKNLDTFTMMDVDFLQKKLMGFLAEMEDVIGCDGSEWNTNFGSSFEQRKAIDQWLGIDGPLYQIKGQNLVLLQYRNAAWPSKKEEEKMIGGTFADRFVYLTQAVLTFLTSSEELRDGMLKEILHTAPVVKPEWIGEDGKCKECGGDVVTNKNGKLVCNNVLCPNHVAAESAGVPREFGQKKPGASRPRPQGGGFQPRNFGADAPVSTEPQRDWHGKKDRRHNRDDEDEGAFGGKKFKKRGPRYRQNDDESDELPASHHLSGEDGRTIQSTPGSENFGSMAGLFDGLKLGE